MTSTLSAVVVDCRDPETLARFWCAALGYVVHAEAEGFVYRAVRAARKLSGTHYSEVRTPLIVG